MRLKALMVGHFLTYVLGFNLNTNSYISYQLYNIENQNRNNWSQHSKWEFYEHERIGYGYSKCLEPTTVVLGF